MRESPFSAIMQGLFIGISIEGFSRWGPDPLFYPLDPPATKAAAAAAAGDGGAGVVASPTTPNPVAVVDFGGGGGGGAGAAKTLETMPLAGAASPSLVGDSTTAASPVVLGTPSHAAAGASQQPNIGTAVLVPPSPSGTTVVQSPLSVV